jgi:hypothetical protein
VTVAEDHFTGWFYRGTLRGNLIDWKISALCSGFLDLAELVERKKNA